MRTHKDIKDIAIRTTVPGYAGWVVNIRYNDGKQADFTVDLLKDKEEDMLSVTYKAIRQQMKAHNAVRSDTK